MTEMTPELRAAIDTAQARVKVEGYYTKIATQGLFGHAKGYIGGALLGMATGALAGLTCLAAMGMAGILLPAGLSVTGLMLGVTSMGAIIGGPIGSRVGASAGTVAAGFEERERRDRAAALEREILASPDKQRVALEEYHKNPVVEKGATIRELYATHGFVEATKQMFDVKTIIFATVLCAAIGAIVCSGAFMLMGGGANALGWGLLAGANPLEAGIIGAGLGAASGASFGIGYPAIFGSLTHRASDMLTGKMVRGKSEFGHVKTVPEIKQEMVHNHEISDAHVQIEQAKPQGPEMPLNQIRDISMAGRIADAPQRQLTA